MKKTIKHYLEDINQYIDKILDSTDGIEEVSFSKNELLQDATLRRLEVLGEIVKRLPSEFTSKYPEIPWREIARTRDKLIHGYEGVNISIVWEIIETELTPLKTAIVDALENMSDEDLEFEDHAA